ncbi:MAG: DNA recombination protein RmuC [Defluviitaleaceae bacterium]|nr:DNA recombination protein RmuC [Defluviitaleaceae bacterium]MCL2276194.1 DNA recombination protein RmuC [Defluviitaleaceae bacterium]
MDPATIRAFFSIIVFVGVLIVVFIGRKISQYNEVLREGLTKQLSAENSALRAELDAKLDRLRDSNEQALHRFLSHTTDSLEKIRTSVDTNLAQLQLSNEKKLDEMRLVVNEKLEKTLEARLQQSFSAVSTQLESVNKGLGEMKSVAQSVGSLNRMLSGQKSRGILGEVQLGHIIEDMLPSQLYEKEYAIKHGSTARVEYAVKLPGIEDGHPVFLPIDSKFPLEAYERLLDGYDAADTDAIEAARRELFTRIRTFAKDVKTKYVSPPETTPFAVIFLPTEGLYAEVVRDAAFFETLRGEGIIITGPTTFSAMLGSLQLGFKTLQIQKGAADIEKTLGAVKKEFANFETVLTKAQQKITQAGNDLEMLVGTRSRAISRSLRDVQVYTGDDAPRLLGITEDDAT